MTVTSVAQAQVTLQRSDFVLSEWEQVVLRNSTGLVITPTTPASGGNDGSYLQINVDPYVSSGQQQRDLTRL